LSGYSQIKELKKMEGWFSHQILGRVHTKNNCLIIVEGETGSGKSMTALNLAQHFDRFFSPRRIAFTGQEFLELLKYVPHKGWVVWDEVGVSLSHREWRSELSIDVIKVIESFRYKLINVIFTVPSAKYIDRVAREMCHYLLRMKARGQASVYRIKKSPFEGYIFTPFIGTVHTELPTKMLLDEFYKMHAEHQEEVYERARKQLEARTVRDSEKLERALTPKETVETLKEKALLILPQIVNINKDSDQGLLDISSLRDKLRIPHNRAYRVRKVLLRELHKNDDRLLRELREEKSAK
jgi:hypothetical protein